MQMGLIYFTGLTPFQSIYYNGKEQLQELNFSILIDVAGNFIETIYEKIIDARYADLCRLDCTSVIC